MKNVQVKIYHDREIKVLLYTGDNIGEIIEFLQHKGSMAIVTPSDDKSLNITVGFNKFKLTVNSYLAYSHDGKFFSLFPNEVAKSINPPINDKKKDSPKSTLVIKTRSEEVEVYNLTLNQINNFLDALNDDKDFVSVSKYTFQRMLIESVEIMAD